MSEVVVVGAGVFGLACAVRLAEAGLKVRVMADMAPEATASGVAAGMLAPAFETALDPPETDALDLMLAARDLWPALARRLGTGLDRSGALATGPAGWLAGLEARMSGLGLPTEAVGRSRLEAWAPGVNPAFERGFVCREDWRVEPRPVLAALASRLEELGGGVERGRLTPGAAIGAGSLLVLAGGADRSLSLLAPELACLSPIKGQILARSSPSGPAGVVRTRGAYALAAGQGIAAGATMEPGREDLDADLEAQAGLRQAVSDLFPGLPQSGWETRVGVRAASPDGLPLAGRSRHPGVFIAAGARRNGWLLAPLVAEIVTAAVTGEDAGPWAGRLDPARFGERREGDWT